MGWFDEQIRQRIKNDQDIFEKAIYNMMSSIDGKYDPFETDRQHIAKKSVEEIISYFGFTPKEGTGDLKDAVKTYGIMYRRIKLEGKWYKDAYGPMLAYHGSNNKPVALIPKGGQYKFFDYEKKRRIAINASNYQEFEEEAYCFYRPLPRKKLSITDLLIYMKNCMDISDLALYVFLVLMLTLGSIFSTQLTGFITVNVLASKNIPMLVGTAAYFFTVIIANQLFEASSELVKERIEIKSSISVESAVMSRVLNLPAVFFKNFSSGELASRIDAVDQICSLIVENLFALPVTIVISMLYVFQIGNYARCLVMPSVAIVLVSLVVSMTTIALRARINKMIMAYDADEDGLSYALINGIQKIKLAGAEKRAFAKWANNYNMSARLSYSPPPYIIYNGTINKAIDIIGTIILYYSAVKGGVTPGVYIAFGVAFGYFQGIFAGFEEVASAAAQITPVLNLAEPILSVEPEGTENKITVERLSGGIELSNISFKYGENSPYVLKGLNLKVKPGEYVAIVGKTGCGKSTIMRLLLGFEKPDKGAVYYDGRDIERLDPGSLRRKIGSVTQDGSLFEGDIFSNIVISAPTLTLKDAWEAAEIAGIADDIKKMPMGMNTIISEGQGGISGGQKQRLMIARAIAPKPKVLLLDEATSALDNITQKKVSDALYTLKCTRIVVAHRLSTVKNCDRIVVLDEGHIVEDGTYDDLLAKNGYFAELVKRQQL
ncbi:MAG: ATP-binding cassette domain-containing protein [Butyrivibrio sp.]|uniref:ATP-binding cassette domain-containing protein n=1 Tax=Butyrivibrio sp. TaxID=28121 RepID=UPI001B04A38F|nr:ATP-binding cassette domain-containing protein [Butyrivibrio sp.]MBO6241833.1 ATP-binding cassette domain-containing protein [Butyrivibrio sp.]